MRCLIVGAGSIGVYLGCKLYKGGNQVILLGREKLKQISSEILIDGKKYFVPEKRYSFPKGEKFDFIFLCSKLHSLKPNLKQLKKNKIEGKYLYSIQNGLVDNSKFKKYLKNYFFSTLSIFEGFRLLKKKLLVSHSKRGWRTDKSKAGLEVEKLLIKSKINCISDKNIEKTKAEKMLMNCMANVLSALENKTFYQMFHDKKIKSRMDKLFYESYMVLSKIFKLRSSEKERKNCYDTFGLMKHYSSTYQDAIKNKKSEIDFLNGYLVKLGKKVKVKTPENKKLIKEYKKKFI